MQAHRFDETEKPVFTTQHTGQKSIIILGNPNVGKSVLFNALTGSYVTVSNYPGTTVEVSEAKLRHKGQEYHLIDTPGMYSLIPITEEERVGRSILLSSHPSSILHVVDAKNIDRMLPLTLQLVEAGLPVILIINMMDEAEALGIDIDVDGLAQRLGIAVVPVVAVKKKGLEDLLGKLSAPGTPQPYVQDYGEPLESAIKRLCELIPPSEGFSRRFLALQLLQNDPETLEVIQKKTGDLFFEIKKIINTTQKTSGSALHYLVASRRQNHAHELLQGVVSHHDQTSGGIAEALSQLCMNPWSGSIIVLLVLYYGLYKFVGGFGAGVLVDFLETAVFEEHFNPWVSKICTAIVPWNALQELFVGEYGIITLGLRYAVAIVLPIVGTFFFTFSILEDSGYFPRMAMLIDRLFKLIGLNGRAVIPMVLGFGCGTMATMVTRIQETKRERLITTLLLALAIPCSAQLGVIMGILAGKPLALAVWGCFILGIFLLVGFLTARVLPGSVPSFYMEIPPLRFPKASNVLIKTYSRMQWYFLEIMPLFILASVLIWLGNITGLFQMAVTALQPIVHLLGLPPEAAVAFLFGFFRRDYGAAGLYDLSSQLTGGQLVVAAAALTLFLPCIAQFLIMKKERGLKTALGISLFIFPFAFLVSWVLKNILLFSGVAL